MDICHERNGTAFLWSTTQALANLRKHGVSFEQACAVFFDPLVRVVDASRNDEARDAAIGYDDASRLLFVVHTVIGDDAIRIISARRATPQERHEHDNSWLGPKASCA